MTRRRILIDGYFFDRSYGFGRYVRELVRAIDLWLTDFDFVLLVPREMEQVARAATSKVRVVSRARQFFPLWEQVVVPKIAFEMGCDIVHFPYQSTALAWPCASTVVTIHDLMFLRAQTTSTKAIERLAHIYRRVAFLASSRYSRHILAVSEATATELRLTMGVRSTVVENACEGFVSSHAEDFLSSDIGPFFLHRGDAGPHKNTRRVVEAFASLRRSFGNVSLLVYGATVDKVPFLQEPPPGVTVIGKVSDERLAALYKAAVAVVTPSIEEGFGLAIIEALGFGTAVVTSNISPMCDLAGNAALLVDPTSSSEIEEAMRRLLAEPALRASLLEEGIQQYRRFSSRRMADGLRTIYEGFER